MRAVLILACILGAASAGAVSAAPRVGTPAPDLSLPDRAGKTVSLAALRGKVVVVDFWASWCGPCKKELPALDALARRWAAKGRDVVVLAINIDRERANADRFLRDAKVGAVTVLYDPKGEAAERYDLPTMPTSFVIDPRGVVRLVHPGYRPGDERKIVQVVNALLR